MPPPACLPASIGCLCLLQAWGILEGEQGNVEEARRLLRRASRVDPNHLYVWQAWGCLEYRQQNYEQGESQWLVDPGVGWEVVRWQGA